MSSDIKFKQVNQLIDKFSAMNWDNNRVTQLGQAGEEVYRNIEALLDDRAEVTMKSRLSAPTPFTLPAIKKLQRLSECDGVWLFLDTKQLFVSVKKLSRMEECTLQWHDLLEPRNDFELIDELGGEETAVFDSAEELESAISQLIDMDGELLRDGRANIFFVRDPEDSSRVLYVHVLWLGPSAEWHVYASPCHADRWDAGDRVFRATAT